MSSNSDFLRLMEKLKTVYDKLEKNNRNRLEETIQMVLSKFEKRI